MKKIALFGFIVFALILAGCSEITDEITLNKDGSGTLTSTNDMSMLISMLKTMGGPDISKGDNDKVDTTLGLEAFADSIADLSKEEKALLKKARMTVKMSLEDEKMLTRMEVPFSNVADIDKIKALSAKMNTYILSKSGSTGGMPAGLEDKMPSSTDATADYFITTYGKGFIERKLNKEKYANVGNDEGLKMVKEMADNGMPTSNSLIINLPAPAKSVTGKNVTLSEDKKKVTVKSTTEDFFDNAAGLEFRIEY